MLTSLQYSALYIAYRFPLRCNINLLLNFFSGPINASMEMSHPISKESLTPMTSTHNLQSNNIPLLRIPRSKICSTGFQAFCSAAPQLLNGFPDHLRASQILDHFKRESFFFLNGFLLSLCFCNNTTFKF